MREDLPPPQLLHRPASTPTTHLLLLLLHLSSLLSLCCSRVSRVQKLSMLTAHSSQLTNGELRCDEMWCDCSMSACCVEGEVLSGWEGQGAWGEKLVANAPSLPSNVGVPFQAVRLASIRVWEESGSLWKRWYPPPNDILLSVLDDQDDWLWGGDVTFCMCESVEGQVNRLAYHVIKLVYFTCHIFIHHLTDLITNVANNNDSRKKKLHLK